MIPSGWSYIRLGEIGDIVPGLTYSPDDVSDEGILVYRSSNIQDGRLSFDDTVYVNLDIPKERISREGDILICVRNGSKRLIGKSALITRNTPVATHGAFMTVFRSDEYKFVFQLLQTKNFKKQVDSNLGATINSINGSDLKQYRFLFPPKNERDKIAEILLTWDNAIEVLDKIIHEKSLELSSVLRRMFYTDQYCEIAKLEDVANISMGTSPSSASYNTDGYGLPLIQGNADIKKRKSSPKQFTSEITKECNPGDILLSVRAPAGIVAISEHHACIGRGIAAIKAKDNKYQLSLYYSLLSRENDWRSLTKGSTFESINSADVKNFQIRIPKVEHLPTVTGLLSCIDRSLQLSIEKRLLLIKEKEGLVQQLLTGKKRVKV